jgi:transglutaminase-like putative cysteine protease
VNAFLAASELVDHHHLAVREFSAQLRRQTEIETVRSVYEAVRDRFPHSYDISAQEVSVSASDVLRHRHGICFAKAHLLAATLRARGIPTGFCYQRLLLDDEDWNRTCLHGFNAVWLRELGLWHRLDARGNKPGIAADFDLTRERLAYPVRPSLGERDYPEIYQEPPLCIAEALRGSASVCELDLRLPADLN